jgi:hypothetical protein
MEFGLDIIGGLRDRFGVGSKQGKDGDGREASLLEWPGLHARLNAAYDARRELLGREIGSRTARGSFDRSAAARLSAASYGLYLVNPADLADGKVQPCIEADVAEPNIGDQGK